MSSSSNIEWTEATWNPIVGCSIVSKGCTNCYAMTMAARIEAISAAVGRDTHYAGTTKRVNSNTVWTGKLALAPDHILTAPLRWKKPRRIFVNSMGDLFHEDATDEWIDRCFAVMALAPQHTFQILTKRPARMLDYFDAGRSFTVGKRAFNRTSFEIAWPLPNVWLGVSAEDQVTADERIPLLLDTPAAVRFVSFEPLLGPIAAIENFGRINIQLPKNPTPPVNGPLDRDMTIGEIVTKLGGHIEQGPRIHWAIVGGESGSDARPFHTEWATSLIDQCRAAEVAVFVKQLGSHVIQNGERRIKKDRKGGDWSEWPHELRVREFPA